MSFEELNGTISFTDGLNSGGRISDWGRISRELFQPLEQRRDTHSQPVNKEQTNIEQPVHKRTEPFLDSAKLLERLEHKRIFQSGQSPIAGTIIVTNAYPVGHPQNSRHEPKLDPLVSSNRLSLGNLDKLLNPMDGIFGQDIDRSKLKRTTPTNCGFGDKIRIGPEHKSKELVIKLPLSLDWSKW